MKFFSALFFAALNVSAQTNDLAVTNPAAAKLETNQPSSAAQPAEQIRAECLQGRRIICGKILKMLPDGLVVDSGYVDLLRPPVNNSWLVPGTVTATRDPSLVEASQPDAVCIGLVFVTDLPKPQDVKPRVYDYVNLEAFPVGQYTYKSVGDLQRTVRKFSTKLAVAVRWQIEQAENQNAPSK